MASLSPNEVGRIAQHVRKEGRKEGKNGEGISVTIAFLPDIIVYYSVRNSTELFFSFRENLVDFGNRACMRQL